MPIQKRKTKYYHNSDKESVADAQKYKRENPDAELVQDDSTNHRATGASALSVKSGSLLGVKTMEYVPGLTAKSGGYEMSAIAKLRSAKKEKAEAQAPRKKDLQGEVSFGPTEVKPEREAYMNRLKKRAK